MALLFVCVDRLYVLFAIMMGGYGIKCDKKTLYYEMCRTVDFVLEVLHCSVPKTGFKSTTFVLLFVNEM